MGLGDFCHFARKIGQKSPNRISRGDTRPTSWSVWSAQPTPPELPQRAPGTSLQLCPLRQAQPVPAGCLLRFGNVPPARSLRLVLPAAKLLFLLPITNRPPILKRERRAIIRPPGFAGRGAQRRSRRVRTCGKQWGKHFKGQKSRNHLRCNGSRLLSKFFKNFSN